MRVYHVVTEDSPTLGVKAGYCVSYDASDPTNPYMLHKGIDRVAYEQILASGVTRDAVPTIPSASPDSRPATPHGRPRLTLVRASA